MNKMSSPVPIKVVTVDDSQLIADRLQTLLSELEGIQFMGNARNIASALRLINDQKPNVVMLDIHLEDDVPLGNGMSLIPPLRKTYPNMKIIMLTNLTGDYYRTRCLAMGANYFFDKTNDFNKISDTLKEISNNTEKIACVD
jgi:DNA-binding NarL/FixJ family response regulator